MSKNAVVINISTGTLCWYSSPLTELCTTKYPLPCIPDAVCLNSASTASTTSTTCRPIHGDPGDCVCIRRLRRPCVGLHSRWVQMQSPPSPCFYMWAVDAVFRYTLPDWVRVITLSCISGQWSLFIVSGDAAWNTYIIIHVVCGNMSATLPHNGQN